MDSETNQHGLKRGELNEEVRRAVRQRCHFGCVVCGSAVVQYHHFDPPFHSAKEHRAEGITLLCGGCHDKVSRGQWSDAFVRKYNSRPAGAQRAPHSLLDLEPPLTFIAGSIVLTGTGPLILVDGETLLEFSALNGEGMAMSANFLDDQGQTAVRIERNELILCTIHWDVTFVGRHLCVRSEKGRIVFEAIFHPPHGVFLKKLDMAYRGMRFFTDQRGNINIFNQGKIAIRLTEYVFFSQGNISLECKGINFQGPTKLIPFPGDRLAKMAKKRTVQRDTPRTKFYRISCRSIPARALSFARSSLRTC